MRENGRRDPVTPETMFQAASISKPVTAVATFRLVERDVLDLDEDVNRYLVSWKVPANGSWQPRVTIRQILSHTAGLTVHGFPGYNREQPVPELLQVLNGTDPANTSPVQVNVLPGIQFRYAGGGTSVLQQLLVDVLGKSFPELMHELVFEPLGMQNSTYEQPLPGHREASAAAGHRVGGAVVAGGAHVYPEMAAAGLWTTPSDLANLVIDLQNAMAGKSGTLLSRQSVEQMLTPQVPNSYGWSEMVGLGFFLDGKDDAARFSHGGDNEGFKALLVAYSKAGKGAIVMANGDGGWILNDEVMRTLADIYQWHGYTSPQRPAVELAPGVIVAYAGIYELRPGYQLVVAPEGGTLLVTATGQRSFRLQPMSETEFFAADANVEVSFERGEDGGVTTLSLRQNGASLPAPRVGEAQDG